MDKTLQFLIDIYPLHRNNYYLITSRYITFTRIFINTFILSLLLIIPIWLFLLNISSSTHFEESVGFRYFHSLRLTYSQELPTLPQGQLPGLLHILIQKALTICGYPIDQFFPRIDIFSFIAVCIPLAIAAFLYTWATKHIRSISLLVVFCLIFSLIFSSTRLQDGWMLLPDYHIWIISMSLLCVGWLFRLFNDKVIYSTYIALGLFFGICLGTKFTLVTLPFIITTIVFNREKNLFNFAKNMTCLTVPISILTFFTILTIYYMGNVKYVFIHLKFLNGFMQSARYYPTNGIVNFIRTSLIPTSISDAIILIPLGILSLWIATIRSKNKLTVTVLSTIAFIELYLLYKRNYSHTMVEVLYSFLPFFTVSILLLRESYLSGYTIIYSKKIQILKSLTILASVAILSIHLMSFMNRTHNFKERLQIFDNISKEMHDVLKANPGKTVFIIPFKNNPDEYNLHSIDMGLFKSAGNNIQQEWNESLFLTRIFNQRWYSSKIGTLPNFADYNKIVFRTAIANTPETKENIHSAILRMQDHFKYDFSEFDCDNPIFSKTNPADETLVVCTKKAQKLFQIKKSS